MVAEAETRESLVAFGTAVPFVVSRRVAEEVAEGMEACRVEEGSR